MINFFKQPSFQGKRERLLSHTSGFLSKAHFPDIKSSNVRIFWKLDRLRISQIIKSWFFLCNISFFNFFLLSHFTTSRKEKPGLISNTSLRHLLSSVSKFIVYKFCLLRNFRKQFSSTSCCYLTRISLLQFPVTGPSLPSEPSAAALLVSVFLLTVFSKQSRLFVSGSSNF